MTRCGKNLDAADKDVVNTSTEMAGSAVRGKGGQLHPQIFGHVVQEIRTPGQPGVEIAAKKHRTAMEYDLFFQLAHLPPEIGHGDEIDGVDIEDKEFLAALLDRIGGADNHFRQPDNRFAGLGAQEKNFLRLSLGSCHHPGINGRHLSGKTGSQIPAQMICLLDHLQHGRAQEGLLEKHQVFSPGEPVEISSPGYPLGLVDIPDKGGKTRRDTLAAALTKRGKNGSPGRNNVSQAFHCCIVAY